MNLNWLMNWEMPASWPDSVLNRHSGLYSVSGEKRMSSEGRNFRAFDVKPTVGAAPPSLSVFRESALKAYERDDAEF